MNALTKQPWLLGVGSRQKLLASATLSLNFLSGPLDPRIIFTRASTATYFDATGTMQTAAINTPRFDTDPVTLQPRGLMMEDARTNLLLNSATLVTQSVTTTAVLTTLSFYGTGSVTLSGTSTGTVNGTGAATRVISTFTPTAGSLTLTVTGSVTNAQLEAGGVPTSYIPTAGTTATRAVEAATMTDAVMFASTAKAMVVEGYMVQNTPTGQNCDWLILDDGTASNYMAFIQPATGSSIRTTIVVSGSTLFQPFIIASNGVFKAGMSTSATWTSAVNGVLQSGSGGVLTPSMPALSRMRFGVGGTTLINGCVRRVMYWQRALSNFEVQSLTR